MFSVIFEVHPGAGRREAYLEHAKMLKPELEGMDGFIDNERFVSRTRPGRVLSHSTWRDEKSVIRWRTHAGHHLIQEKGRFEIFSDYHLRVGEVTADSHPPQGHAVREQRLDATEVGRSKACLLIEAAPREGQSLPDDLVGALGLAPAGDGLVAADVFDSFYNPGKVMLLSSWIDADAASAFTPAVPAEAARIRVRSVRVIRDYGMFDRRESPQFYPPVDQRERR
ncbi:antibiotic biosynthesis monooxygenase [Methylobacterium sp. J-048]|uniref:antibiotic biosynthesis monooxygenase family protein n=1 Tax=Methylobacterium sp. J-048 TaxID=2836635 RepID=UPI001FB885C3|nr:antibiotic biosynthesis monooxygenase [Methylobacterium sp. J-048]MCJ2058505.1 antibiotic biosynthesis monooxygenase [Methylobacterium sp. J-048]